MKRHALEITSAIMDTRPTVIYGALERNSTTRPQFDNYQAPHTCLRLLCTKYGIEIERLQAR